MLNCEKEEFLIAKHVLVTRKWLVVLCFSIQACHLNTFLKDLIFRTSFEHRTC